jgi:hypothetical protein
MQQDNDYDFNDCNDFFDTGFSFSWHPRCVAITSSESNSVEQCEEQMPHSLSADKGRFGMTSLSSLMKLKFIPS